MREATLTSSGTTFQLAIKHKADRRNHATAVAAATRWKTTVKQRLTFLKVPLCKAVPIPPLEVEIAA